MFGFDKQRRCWQATSMLKRLPWQHMVNTYLQDESRPTLVVLGPTASGKTRFSIALAVFLHSIGRVGEVVNADSRQLYRSLDIGTAKIQQEEMQGVSHHLFSVIDPKDPVSIAWYKDRAQEAIEGIHERGNVPILVGGSMLYLSAVIDSLEPLPPVDDALRGSLGLAYDADGGAALYKRLQEIDPETAAQFSANNKPYLIRAMEIFLSSGRPASAQRCKSERTDMLIFGCLWPRAALTERINQRTREMLQSGWIDEVQSLLASGYGLGDPGMQSHGYREIAQWITAGEDQAELPALEERIAANTRKYAKRQMTWWKRDSRIVWINPESGELQATS